MEKGLLNVCMYAVFMVLCDGQVSDVTLSNLAMHCPKLSKLVSNCGCLL